MGSPFPPNYANPYVGQFEEALLFKTETHPLLSKILLWKRYIDDVFVLWEGSQQELNEFQTLLNESSEYLTFTMQTDEIEISYLDSKTMMHYTQTTIHCYVRIICIPFPSRMVYHMQG